MMRRGLRGNHDLWAIALIAAITAMLGFLLLDHLQVRQELYTSARERSHAAFLQRQLLEEQRHLSLENRIRQAAVERPDENTGAQPARPERTLVLPLREHLEERPSHGEGR